MLASGTSPHALPPSANNSGGSGSASHVQGGISQKALNTLVKTIGEGTDALEQVFQTFWGKGIQVRLLAVSPKMLYFWKYDNFYVSQASSNIHLRLSDSGCSALLTKALGKRDNNQSFSFSTLTGFEASLLTTFSREVLTHLAKQWIQPSALKPNSQTASSQANKDKAQTIQLVWAVMPEGDSQDQESGKLILSLPLSALKVDKSADETGEAAEIIQEHWLYHAYSTLRLGIGSGKIPIGSLEQLEPNDILLLENSSIHQLFAITSSERVLPNSSSWLPFPIQLQTADAIRRTDLHYDIQLQTQEAENMSPTETTDNRQALLDNLMIDVGAEFTPVRMPLHQIKQMSEGLVVEIADLVHNEILLTVEGKPLALGELVVVGDKFGVRVVSLTPDGDSLPTRPVKTYPAPMAANIQEAMKETAAAPAPARAPEPVAPQPQQQAAPAPPPPAAAAPEPAAELNDDFLNDDFDDDDDDW